MLCPVESYHEGFIILSMVSSLPDGCGIGHKPPMLAIIINIINKHYVKSRLVAINEDHGGGLPCNWGNTSFLSKYFSPLTKTSAVIPPLSEQ